MTRHSTFVELDREFRNDPSGDHLKRRFHQLESGMNTYRSHLDAGVSADEARTLKMLISAYAAALAVLPTLWKAQHQMEK